MMNEIQTNIATNSGFSTEMQYWQNLSLKIKAKIAINTIEQIYRFFLQKNKEKIDTLVEEERKREEEEAARNHDLEQAQKVKVKLSLAEKIQKTALNTGIRFNIVDNLGFDNASLSMFQDAQKTGLNADE